MKKALNILLILFITTAMLPLQTVEATVSSYAETFYGYKTASYYKSNAKEGAKTSDYEDGYYRDAYGYHFQNKGSSNVKSESIEITKKTGQAGKITQYCFENDKEYHITHVSMDIDQWKSPGSTPNDYTQPHVTLLLDGKDIGATYPKTDNEQTNGWWNGDEDATGKCLVWRVDDTCTWCDRTTAGGDNGIDYYYIQWLDKEWFWNESDLKQSYPGATNISVNRNGHVDPSWSSTSDWVSSIPYNDIKYGSAATTAQDRKGVSFTVIYNPNGADGGTVNPQPYTANLASNNYYKTGYTFDGWYTASTGGTKVTTINDLDPTEGGSTTVYAHWKANTYQVCYNYNHPDTSSGGIASDINEKCQTKTYDQEFMISSGFVNNSSKNEDLDTTLYWFKGWNTNQYGTGTTYNEGQTAKNLTSVNNGTVRLYGKWMIKNYYINFDKNANDASGSMNKLTCLYSYEKNDECELPDSGFSRQGYVQIGWTMTNGGTTVEYGLWTKNSNGNTKIDSHGTNTIVSQTAYFKNWYDNRTTNLIGPGETKTLYAVWAKKTYQYTLNCLTNSSNQIIDNTNYDNSSLADTNTTNQTGWLKDDSTGNIYVNENNTKYTETTKVYCSYASDNTKACKQMCVADNDYTYIVTWQGANNYNKDCK